MRDRDGEPGNRTATRWSRGALRDLALLLGGLTLGLACFVDKPVHVDDTVYLRVADRIREHPGDPYGFVINWHGTREAVHAFNQNPPGVSYVQALAAAFLGGGERVQHGVAALWAMLAAVGIYGLACRLCRSPGVAAGLALVTPAFFVSATTLMSDVPMLALWCGALAAWIQGLDTGRKGASWLAAGLAAWAILTKYFAIALLPLLALYAWQRGERSARRFAPLLLPVAVVAIYEVFGLRQYGHGLLLQAPGYAASVRTLTATSAWNDGVVALAFLGGGLFPLALLAPRIFGRSLAAGAILAGVAAAAFASELPVAIPSEASRGWLLAHLLPMAWAGAFLPVLAIAEWRRAPRDSDTGLLVSWTLGVVAFVAVANWTSNARAVLPLVPCAAILVVRALEAREGRPPSRWLAVASIASGIALTAVLARADQAWADTARRAAQELARDYDAQQRRVFFQGHWGFQYYFERSGGRAYDVRRDTLEAGDILVMPRNNAHLTPLPPGRFEVLEVRELGTTPLATLMGRGAGFYSSIWGPVPFVLGPSEPERYRVMRVSEAIPPRQPGRGAVR